MIKEINTLKPDDAVINMLKGLLERAELGEIQSIAFAGTTEDGCVFNQFVGGYYTMSLIGELSLLKRDMIDICCDVRKEVSWDFCNV